MFAKLSFRYVAEFQYVDHSIRYELKYSTMIMTSLFRENFQSHVFSSLREIYVGHQLSDITLSSDDHTQFQAHKYVLGAASPVLRNIFLLTSHPEIQRLKRSGDVSFVVNMLTIEEMP